MSFTTIFGVAGLADDNCASIVIAEQHGQVTSRRELDRAVVADAIGATHLAFTTTPTSLAVA